MGNELKDDAVWGHAHQRRGANHHDLACAFIEAYPMGSQLTQEAWALWLQARDVLTLPKEKSGPEWEMHCRERNQWRYRMNRAAAHPRMADDGRAPFALDRAGNDLLEVRSAYDAIVKANFAHRSVTHTDTQHRKLTHLMQSADWSNIPPHEKALAETIYDDLDEFRDNIKDKAARIDHKVLKLEKKLRAIGISLPTVSDSTPPLLTYIESSPDPEESEG